MVRNFLRLSQQFGDCSLLLWYASELMATKSLTFKPPDKMKTIGLIFVVAFLIFPQVRYTTGSILHSTANFIQGTAE
jgi:hypothetical protein